MTQQTLLAVQRTTEVEEKGTDQYSDCSERKALLNIQSILVDASLEVGALIDAVCCRCGEWVDLHYYQPHPGTRGDGHMAAASIIRLALAENDCGLRAGGYVEMYIPPEEKVVEADGGYYDEYHQPQQVIEGSMRWQDVNHQTVGQALLLMYDRIMREYMAGAGLAKAGLKHPAVWTRKPAHLAYVTNGGHNLAAVGTT
jgi:hypothetical protein